MILNKSCKFEQSQTMKNISSHWLQDEHEIVSSLIDKAVLSDTKIFAINDIAKKLIKDVRNAKAKKGGLDAFMVKYDLSSEEGVILMCLAEALLRIPDKYTADKLIKDKITKANWHNHSGDSEHLFVNTATQALMLASNILKTASSKSKVDSIKAIVNGLSTPIIRKAVFYMMRKLGKQYVMGETIKNALDRAKKYEKQGYCYSYDMLGEAAISNNDAEYYYKSYYDSILAIGKNTIGDDPYKNPGISVKLSALHPRYEVAQIDRLHSELYPKLLVLTQLAHKFSIGINIDAEETERLEISLELFKRLALEPSLVDFNGLGIVVQAYQKRALYVLDYIIELAKQTNHKFMLRLVKGAYWDSEIKSAQEQGFSEYPVFTRKAYTDVSYQACVKKLFENIAYIYPQFATHNALTVATVMEIAGNTKDYEFQCLHGMGNILYDHIVGVNNFDIPCRIYAPVGTYKHLLPYLVRRLLENGANSSFVNLIADKNTSIEELIKDPIKTALSFGCNPHSKIALPINMFGDSRMNSKSYNLNDTRTLEELSAKINIFALRKYKSGPLVLGVNTETINYEEVINPATLESIGNVKNADIDIANKAMQEAIKSFDTWSVVPAVKRASMIDKFADLLEENMPKLITIVIIESGKTLANALGELREAIDFCRYYASQARKEFAEPIVLPGPTGELNQISLHGRGAMVCISPWNFPLAIFIGQITASLAAGNAVVAKPAEQTPIIAYEAVQLMLEAGIPLGVIQLVTGSGETVGAKLVEHDGVSGVIFTGSTQVAKIIQRTLAEKAGPIVPLIAETGGQNVMVVDSSSLPEQVVKDVIASSFDSAGQRCSALRVLYLQSDIADSVIDMLKGAMDELTIANPIYIETDIGPVIDIDAKNTLDNHILSMKKNEKLIYQCKFNDEIYSGTFVLPSVIEIQSISELKQEMFGPILHIIRFKGKDLDKVVEDVNGAGYGLTFGIHSRIDETIEYFKKRIKVGNIYVNRNMVGAIVGCQPFGGEGLSGTGPKAGGPFYMHRLAIERCVSIDITASGGNASLMTLSEQ